MNRTITAIRAQQRRRDRVSVYLDGSYAFGLQSIIAAELRIGQVLSAEQIAELKRRDEAERAFEATLRYLTYRPRSRSEVEQYLAKRQVPAEQARDIVARLERLKLVDDAAFAMTWVDNRNRLRPRGRWALRHELRLKGVNEVNIERAIADVDESKGALQVALRYGRRYARYDEPVFKRRLLGLLQRRGYRYGVAAPAVAAAWERYGNAADSEDDTPVDTG
ncbi:MAG: RecX family transcriptional regulator [Chloroflexi bacterium]|nr:RecX family transcriptional regulator [Chloroflexota bacterium]